MINDIVTFIRGCVRPVISIVFACILAQVITEQIPIPPIQWALLSGVILWWFGERTVSAIKEGK